MKRQYAEHLAQTRFEKNLGLLELELRLGSARRHLDPLVELCEIYLPKCGESLLARTYKQRLAEAKARVADRGNLRLVHSR